MYLAVKSQRIANPTHTARRSRGDWLAVGLATGNWLTNFDSDTKIQKFKLNSFDTNIYTTQAGHTTLLQVFLVLIFAKFIDNRII